MVRVNGVFLLVTQTSQTHHRKHKEAVRCRTFRPRVSLLNGVETRDKGVKFLGLFVGKIDES